MPTTPELFDLTGHVAVVTGGGRGIGEGYARDFAARGMKVCVAEIDEENGQRVADAINADGGSAIFVHFWKRPRRPTAGCVAFERADLLWIVRRWRPESRMIIQS